MKLWTIQKEAAYEKFKETGILRADENFIDEHMTFYYDWMVCQMKKRIGPTATDDVKYPVWAWYQWRGIKNKRPDLRFSGHLARGTEGVLLELEVEEKDVLLSDFMDFNGILNNGYITDSEAAYDEFYDELQSHGYEHHDLLGTDMKCGILEKFNLKLLESWEKIFDLNRDVDEDWGSKKEDQSIQAAMWEIKWRQVVSVRHFTAK